MIVKGEFGEDEVGVVAAEGFGFCGKGGYARAVGETDFGFADCSDRVAVLEGEVFGLFAGLAFAAGDDEPVVVRSGE